MAKAKLTPQMQTMLNNAKAKLGSSGTYSSSSSVSNSGQMSSQTTSTGATGAATSTTNIRVSGDPGFPGGQESQVISNYRKMMGL